MHIHAKRCCCPQATGYGGTTQRADGDSAKKMTPVGTRQIRVGFNSDVSDMLPWKFVPQQRTVNVGLQHDICYAI